MALKGLEREVLFTVSLALMAALTNIRLGGLQPEDFVLLLLLGSCILRFLWSGLSFRVAAQIGGLCRAYLWLLLTVSVLALLSFRLEFFSLVGVSILKQPMLFSFSKLLQLASILGGFLWLTNALIKHRHLLVKATTVYWRVGIASAVYSIVCFAWLSIFHTVQGPSSILGAYSNEEGRIRACGFFNEGGPFGIYLVSVFVIGFLHRYTTGRRLSAASLIVLGTAFLLSASKAGFFAAAILFLYSVIAAASFWKKVAYFGLALGVFWSVAVLLNFGSQLNGYLFSYQNLGEEVALRSNDLNLVAGRVAAAYIVPRMIAAHPITGIGFGNYPLMRNDPTYLGILPSIRDVEDVGGIGIPQVAAEIGIPATIWLILLLFTPYWLNRGQASIVTLGALYQPLAHTFAVQVTFFYPWFVSACAIAVCHHVRVKARTSKPAVRNCLSPKATLSAYPIQNLA